MRLVGWSKIGRYLRISPRTARSWRDQWGLPVERVSPRVVQSRTRDIDNWLLAQDLAWRELGVRGRVKLRADRLRVVELALDKLWDAGKRDAAGSC